MGHTPPSIVAGKYEILGRLGEGGQGSVWKVRHVELDQVRALKWQPDEGIDDSASRFRREGLALARLRHPHIVEVFDFGRDADAHYLVMEYVEGQNLAQRFRTRGRPTLPDALEIGRQVADALSYSHRQPYVDSQGRRHEGMIHRDIKPSNILLRDQVKMHVLLADFGLVKLGDPGERTTTGAVMGTYKYSAPEQLGLRRGRERVGVDLRADVFAFGLVLYELLEGRQFHEGLDMGEVLGRVLYEDLEPEFEQPVTARLKALVAACIRRFPEDRPERMDDVLRELEISSAELRGEETQTHLVPHAGMDLDQQIETLLRERDRRRVQTAQAAAQAARRDAAAVEAEAFAGDIFARGVDADDRAARASRGGDNTVAREGFEEAAELFAQAGAAAAAARQRREIEAVAASAAERRAAAEAAGAPADAADAFERGRKLDDDARARLARGELDGVARDLRAAETDYASAARDATAARERREAKAARLQLVESRRAADAVEASRLAADAYRLANDLEAQGEAALGAGDLGAARDLYARSAGAFDRAIADATRERDRRMANGARHDAERARATSDASQASEWARAEHDAAVAILAEAEAAFGRDDHAAAIDAYGRAAEAFAGAVDAARTRSSAAAKTQADDVHGRARAARDAAVAGAVADADLAPADAALATGEALGAREDFVRAEGEYARARLLYEEALRVTRRSRAETAGKRADAAARSAAAAHAGRGAARAHADGQAEIDRARTALAAERYEEAGQGFERAAGAFERAAAEANAARTQAEEARRAALAEREGIADLAADFARDALASADAVVRDGDDLLAAGDGAAAAARFVAARAAFGDVGARATAGRDAAVLRARQAAEAARARAEAARMAALDAGAATDASALVDEAAASFDVGGRAFAADDLAAAARAFAAAGDTYAKAAATATEAQARRQADDERRAGSEAEQARDRAQAARERASRSTAADDASAELASASQHFATATDALRRNDFAKAMRAYEAAATSYAAATDAAEAAASARADAAARARAAEAARARAEAEAREQAAVEARAREQAEVRQREEAAVRAREEAAARAQKEAEARARKEADARARDEAAARERAEAEAKAKAEDEAKAQAAAREAERLARADAEARARAAAEGRRAEAIVQREAAVAAGAERDATRAFDDAKARLGVADTSFAEGRYDVAAEQFVAAAGLFGDAATKAKQAATERARAEAAAREQAERQAGAARERAVAARRDAVDAGAPDDAAAALAAADAERDAATKAFDGGDLAGAATRFGTAAKGYATATAAARTAAKARAEEARQAKARADAEARRAEEAARKAAAEAKKAKERAEADARREQARVDAEATAAKQRAAAERAREDDRTRASIGDADRTQVSTDKPRRTPTPPAEDRTQISADDRTRHDVAPMPVAVPEPPASRSGPSPVVLVGGAAALVALGVGIWMATWPPTPNPPTPGEGPLRWARVTPDELSVAAREGTEVSLGVAIDGAPGSYRWTLDGKPQQASGGTLAFTPDYAGRGRTLDVGVTASRGEAKLERHWTVEVADVPRPPRIESPAAASTKLEVAAGAPVVLEVRAQDPDAADGDVIAYRWERNGQRIDEATDPKLTVPDAHDGDVIRVAAVDRDGQEASRTFTIAMKTEPAPPTPTATTQPERTDHAPVVVELIPPPSALQVAEGGTKSFRARATDADPDDKVTYAWLVDGRKVASDAAFEWTAPADAREKPRIAVQLQVADTTGHRVTRDWTINVTSTRPSIATFTPKGLDTTIKAGEPATFSAHATSARDGARIRYEWTLDDRPLPGAGEQVTLPTDLAAGRHTVAVVARDDRDLTSEVRRWTIKIEELKAVAGELTEADAKRWLDQYRAAWEANDGARLIALGVASNASEADRVTSGWGPREVTVSGMTFTSATSKIVFSRMDRDKKSDREFKFPAPLVYELRRDGDRIRAVR